VDLLTVLIVVILLIWLTGAFVVPVGGSAIHLLFVLVVIIVIVRLLQGRSTL
jgi:hypothetical protein